jgi:hypothetical protein
MLLFFSSDPDLQRIARVRADRGVKDAWVSYHLAVGALADRRPQDAVDLARVAREGGQAQSDLLLGYTLALAGRSPEIRELLPDLPPRTRAFLEGVAPQTPPVLGVIP